MVSGASKLRRIVPRQGSLVLALPPTLAASLDGVLTVVGQTEGYLSGNVAEVQETNPIGHALLSISPLAFALGLAIWIALLVTLIVLVPRRWAIGISLVCSAAHLVGASTWIIRYPAGILWVAVLWLTVRFVVYPAWRQQLSRSTLAD